MKYQHLSSEEKNEIYEDRCEAFELDLISEEEFRKTLGNLGYNATEIEELVRFYRPRGNDVEGEGDFDPT